MGDSGQSVASAVVLPEFNESPQPTPQSTPNGQKRRQSSVSSSASKRPRLSTDATAPAAAQDSAPPSKEPPIDRRRGRQIFGRAEERQRGQRLFGGLLSTLSQSSQGGAGAAARERRKAEIERKQAEKLKARDEEYDEEKKRKLEELTRVRRGKQWIWDEQAMRIRHSNMLAMARFLHTESEPKLYYKPWELRLEEEDRINQQIADAEAQISREVLNFEEKRSSWQKENVKGAAEDANNKSTDTYNRTTEENNTAENDNQEAPETVGAEPTPTDIITQPTNDDTVHHDTAEDVNKDGVEQEEGAEEAKFKAEEKEVPHDGYAKDVAEENGDHVMDAGEDAVIY
ncbi:hypothetical protein EV356DRAFT_503575 [Viridothelium virens]|uniref:Pinin/SDK/MemA protein domain-containing protein n=1 Tax=Viridothelium virens TaxID=1048519 RepID=A0A6A6H648_VIRVR|nr:hypothetical protein EV356DRAFT_503575 [Viridothelium virens]